MLSDNQRSSAVHWRYIICSIQSAFCIRNSLWSENVAQSRGTNSSQNEVDYKCEICSCDDAHQSADYSPCYFTPEEVEQKIAIYHYYQNGDDPSNSLTKKIKTCKE